MAYHGPQGCPLQDGHVDFMFLDLFQPNFLDPYLLHYGKIQ